MKEKSSISATMVFTMLFIIMYALNIINPVSFKHAFVLKNNLQAFYPWQLFTYIFNDSTSPLNYFFKILILFLFSNAIESLWGTLHYSIFMIVTIVSKSIITVLIYLVIPALPLGALLEALLNGFGSLFVPNHLILSLMTVYGFLHPEQVIYLFFIIPIKVKLLSIISLTVAFLQLLNIIFRSPSFLSAAIFSIIYISGYLGLLIYYKRIFSSFKLINHINKMIKPHTTHKNKSAIKTNALSTKDLPLCEPEDFDKIDNYCKSCDRFQRCIDREGSSKKDD